LLGNRIQTFLLLALYHYTNQDAARAIAYSCVIYRSSGGGDAAFGKGVYLTSIGMDAPAGYVANNNWDDQELPYIMMQEGRTNYAVKITFYRGWVAKQNTHRDIYLYRGDLNLNNKNVVAHWEIIQR